MGCGGSDWLGGERVAFSSSAEVASRTEKVDGGRGAGSSSRFSFLVVLRLARIREWDADESAAASAGRTLATTLAVAQQYQTLSWPRPPHTRLRPLGRPVTAARPALPARSGSALYVNESTVHCEVLARVAFAASLRAEKTAARGPSVVH